MKTKLFITDEGFGPIVRQSAIIDELKRIIPGLDMTIQLERHIEQSRHIIPGVRYRKKFNNVIWQKQPNGSPDEKAIASYYKDYNQLAENYIASEKEDMDYHFLISDFVYEAFELAKWKNIPSFGVAHFTWDWFFGKFSPPVIPAPVKQRMIERALLADILFFPAFTPREIVKQYGSKVKEVPLVVRKCVLPEKTSSGKTKKVMFIDSGSGVNRLAMQKIAAQLTRLHNYHFYVGEDLALEGANITAISKKDLLVDHIGSMDLVVGRAGFNTISECIACRTPMLLFGEQSNPEMLENSLFVKEETLGSFVNLNVLTGSVEAVLDKFFTNEFPAIERSMREHTHRMDGATVIAETIADFINA